MTYVYLNYDNMKGVIHSLNSYAESAECAFAAVRRQNDNNNGVVDLSRWSTGSEKIQDLRDKAGEIDDRVELAKLQNETGITTGIPDQGLIAYDCPDGTQGDSDQDYIERTLSSLRAGVQDAHDLERARASLEARETLDTSEYYSILDRISKRGGDPSYAAGFVHEYGIVDTLKLTTPDCAHSDGVLDYDTSMPSDSGIDRASILLSSASQVWGVEKSSQMGNEVVDWLKDSNTLGRSTRLNAVLQNGDRTFGGDFLVSLARNIENEIPWSPGTDDPSHRVSSDTTGETLSGYSQDALVGVMSAMRKVPFSAEDYLFPTPGISPGTTDNMSPDAQRVYNLMQRHPSGDNLWTDSWTSIMAAYSDKYSSEHVDDYSDKPSHYIGYGYSGDEGRPTSGARRSAALTALGVIWLGNTEQISDQARSDLSRTLQNYAWGIDAAASDTVDQVALIETHPADGEPATFRGLTVQPQFRGADLSNVLGLISQDPHEYDAVVQEVALLNRTRMSNAIAEANSGNPNYLLPAMRRSASARGFLLSAGQVEIEEEAKELDARDKLILDSVLGLTTFLPGPAEGLSDFQKNLQSYAQARAEGAVSDYMHENVGNRLPEAMREHAVERDDMQVLVQMDLLYALHNGGMLSDEHRANLEARLQRVRDASDDRTEMMEEMNDILGNSGDIFDRDQQRDMESVVDAYTAGYERARR